MPRTSGKNKRKRINARCDAEYQALRHNVQRRVGSTRHELMRQLPPVPRPVNADTIAEKDKMLLSTAQCVYCTCPATTSDHFEPLVSSGIPSGIIPTDVEVVPCCSWCNSSKGGRTWQSHMQRLKKLKKLTDTQWKTRMKVLSNYADFRKKHEQRWDVEHYDDVIFRLNLMVEECHAFMQDQINKAVLEMHGDQSIQVYARNTNLNWHSIQTQISNYKKNGSS